MDNLEQLVAEKIAAVFGRGAKIESLNAIAGDASSRRYFRALLKGSKTPSSIVIMNFPPDGMLPLSSEELAVFKEAPKELPFLNLHRFLTQIGVRVPRLYGHWQKQGILFLEDLGDLALWDKVQGLPDDQILGWYKKAVDELLLLQIRGSRERDDSCLAFQQRFDFRLYMWEFDHFLEYGLGKRAPAATRTSAVLRESFEKIALRLDSQPFCLNHRDYHSWNLMTHEGAVAVIDFQDALLAPAQYDLASLLNDRITDSLIRPSLEEALVNYYIEKRAALTQEVVSRDEFLEIYLLSALQRDFKVVGRFYYLDLVKGKPGYLKFIPPTLRRMKRNLERTSGLEKLIPILAEDFEELR